MASPPLRSAARPPQVMQLLARGNGRRAQEPTAANGSSSRSHAVLRVTVHQRHRGGGLRRGCLLMVDLAGSERAAQVRSPPGGLRDHETAPPPPTPTPGLLFFQHFPLCLAPSPARRRTVGSG